MGRTDAVCSKPLTLDLRRSSLCSAWNAFALSGSRVASCAKRKEILRCAPFANVAQGKQDDDNNYSG